MRLLFVSHSLPPVGRPMANVGGMQRVASELLTALEDVDHIQLSSRLMRSGFAWSHVRIVPFLANSLRSIRKSAERKEIDVVLFSSMVTASMAYPLRRHLQANGVVTAAIVHGLDITMDFAPYQRFVPKIFDSLDLVLPVSRATAEACVERGLDPVRIAIVPNGIDVDRFAEPPGTRGARRSLLGNITGSDWTLKDEDFVLVSVGRQVKRKGFAWFIGNVMPLLPGNVQYWLAGDGPENENIRAEIAARGLQNRVRMLGRLSESDLSRLYRGADLFVMPNVPVSGDMEGFGVVMLEAGLGGLPVVASKLEGIRDVISEGSNGHFIEPGNAWDFSEEIMRYVYSSGDLERASRRAVQHVRDTFSWKAVADQYVEVLAGQIATEEETQVPALAA